MKVTYYKFWIEPAGKKQRHMLDVVPFLKALHEKTTIEFRMRFKHSDEHVFLLPVGGRTFLLITTRQQEIIKSISSKDLSVSEIQAKMQKDQMIGFASYVYLDKGYFGIGTTMLAPKARALALLVEHFLKEFGCSGYRVMIEPFLKQSTRAEAMQVSFIGHSVVRVSKENSLFENLVGFTGVDENEFADVDAFEVKIIPRRNTNIAKVAKKFIAKVPDKGLDKMTLRAREHLQDELTELYIAGQGTIGDIIDTRDEELIIFNLNEKVRGNEKLKEHLAEFMNHDDFKTTVPQTLTRLADTAAWPDSVPLVPVDGGGAG